MTENEIKNTKEWIEDFIETYALSNQETIEFKKIVVCLEELQQYRVIGTVKGYERAVEVSKENYYLCLEYKAKVQAFEAIGTVEEFKDLKEKNVAKKPIIQGLGQRYCPVCKCGGADHFYCARCGQKLG